MTELILIAIIIFLIVSPNRKLKNSNQEKKNSNKGKYPTWEKQTNPDGTFTYVHTGFSNHQQSREYNPYQRAKILTPTEHQFWERLQVKCNLSNLIVCPKVRMEDIIVVDKNHPQREMLRNKIKSRHIDFIICDCNLKVLAGLELDDNSHLKAEAQKADEFKNEVFSSLDIPLFRIKVEPSKYTEEIVRVISGLKTMNGVEEFKQNTIMRKTR